MEGLKIVIQPGDIIVINVGALSQANCEGLHRNHAHLSASEKFSPPCLPSCALTRCCFAPQTNCWFHATSIPDTSSANDGLSMSYARDFFLGGGGKFRECDMTNVEGTWARHAIKQGTVILREPPVVRVVCPSLACGSFIFESAVVVTMTLHS